MCFKKQHSRKVFRHFLKKIVMLKLKNNINIHPGLKNGPVKTDYIFLQINIAFKSEPLSQPEVPSGLNKVLIRVLLYSVEMKSSEHNGQNEDQQVQYWSSIKPKNLVSHSLRCYSETPAGVSCAFYSGVSSVWPLFHKICCLMVTLHIFYSLS